MDFVHHNMSTLNTYANFGDLSEKCVCAKRGPEVMKKMHPTLKGNLPKRHTATQSTHQTLEVKVLLLVPL